MSHTLSSVIAGHRYRDARRAIAWLVRVLGFEQHALYESPGGLILHAQLTLGGGMIMLGSAREDEYGKRFRTPAELGGIETRSQYIVVADAEAAYARALEADAEIVMPLTKTEYGSMDFTIRDPEGYTWSVGTYDPWTQ
jgi:uncharacterized glyoxalase superfamily protein PhnB